MRNSKSGIILQASILSLLFFLGACAPVKVTPTAAPEADKSRYTTDLEFIAQAPRTIMDTHHKAVQDLCVERLTQLGYKMETPTWNRFTNI
ncbi:MAG: hypothetical protein IPP66_04480 [Anaerolineales bacterium]|nr:hypothetical protein [Anaerolineales bacterium]